MDGVELRVSSSVMMPKAVDVWDTHASVTSARSLRFNVAQFPRTHPLKKCVTGLMRVGL